MKVVNLPSRQIGDDGRYKVTYETNDEDGVIATGHPDWPFQIQRNLETGESAIVELSTSEPFGVLPTDVFNTVLLCHLLATDSKMMIEAAKDLLKDEDYAG